jgi:hypothetical protein
MKVTYQLAIALFLLLCINYSYQRRLQSSTSVGRTKFRIEANKMALASRKFYSTLATRIRNINNGGPKKIDNSSWIGVGYNVVYGNPIVAPQSGKLVDAGFTTSIFTQSFANSNKTPDETYIFPDGWEVQAAKVCKTNFSSQTIKTVTKLRESLNSSLGLNGGFRTYSFSANSEFNQMSSSMNSEDKLYIQNTATCSVYRAVVNRYDPPEFSKNFLAGLESIKGLPFELNKELYYKFITTFGTHYIYDVMMGSRYTYILETTNNSYNTMKSSGVNISAQAKYSAMASIDVKASYKKHTKASSQFDSAITNKFVTSVGAPMPLSMEMNDWLAATNTLPMPISYEIKPIIELFQISVVKNKMIKAGIDADFFINNLQTAYDNYCSFLVESKIIASCNQDNLVTASTSEWATKFNSDGSGSVFHLDRHLIDCGQNSAINYFRLQRGDGNIRYAYRCIKSDNISNTCFSKETPPQSTGEAQKSANYLDRHTISCDAGQVLRSFVLSRNGDNIFYKYNCCTAKVTNCFKYNTPQTDSGDHSIYYLDRQEVDAKESNLFSSIHLVSNNGKFFYETNVCTLG